MQQQESAEQNKEVFAFYGRAMYYAQVLERELALHLGTVYGPDPRTIDNDELEKLLESHFRRSLGALVEKLRKKGRLSERFEAELLDAHVKRNWLAHNYFWDRAAQLTTISGKARMIEELDSLAELFKKLNDQLTALTLERVRQYGITKQDIDEAAEKKSQQA